MCSVPDFREPCLVGEVRFGEIVPVRVVQQVPGLQWQSVPVAVDGRVVKGDCFCVEWSGCVDGGDVLLSLQPDQTDALRALIDCLSCCLPEPGVPVWMPGCFAERGLGQ